MSSTKQGKGTAYGLVAFFTIFMAFNTINLILFATTTPETMALYGIDQAGVTTISSFVSIAALFCGIILGPMLDRFGPRKLGMICLPLSALFYTIRCVVNAYVLVVATSFLGAFFVGCMFMMAPKILETWFPKEKIAVALALQAAGAGFGSAGAFAIGAALGLKGFLWLVAGLSIGLFVCWIFLGKVGPIAPTVEVKATGGLAPVLKSPYVWLISIAASMGIAGPMIVNTYILSAFISRGFDPLMASAMGVVINLGLLVGGYVGTALMAKIKKYNVVAIICFAGGALFYLLAWFLPIGIQTWVLVIIAGLIQGGSIGACEPRTALIPLTGQYPREYIGTAAGVLSVIKGIITFVLPIAIATAFGENFNGIFIAFGVFALIGVLCSGVLVPEVGPGGKLQKEADAAATEA